MQLSALARRRASFHKLCKDKDKVYGTFDEFFVGFAKWVLKVEVLAHTEEQRLSIGEQRRTLCGNTYSVYNVISVSIFFRLLSQSIVAISSHAFPCDRQCVLVVIA